jgi:hypothetical protein
MQKSSKQDSWVQGSLYYQGAKVKHFLHPVPGVKSSRNQGNEKGIDFHYYQQDQPEYP